VFWPLCPKTATLSVAVFELTGGGFKRALDRSNRPIAGIL
jgi:hypothetical protein